MSCWSVNLPHMMSIRIAKILLKRTKNKERDKTHDSDLLKLEITISKTPNTKISKINLCSQYFGAMLTIRESWQYWIWLAELPAIHALVNYVLRIL